MLDYSVAKRALAVFSVDLDRASEAIDNATSAIAAVVDMPPLFRVDRRSEHALYVVQLTREEERAARDRSGAAAGSTNPAGDEDPLRRTLAALDRDRASFVSWDDFAHQLTVSPLMFALDLLRPHFVNDDDWRDVGPDVIDADSPLAARLGIAGGKGRNTHILRRLACDGDVPNLRVPKTLVLTTAAFRRIALREADTRRLVDQLDDCHDDTERRWIAAAVRARLESMALPASLLAALDGAFDQIGHPLAVRSSATVEDLDGYAAAGLAHTELGIATKPGLHKAVTKVWASLYSDGFVSSRRVLTAAMRRHASMAVLLQRVIEPAAAGVALSVFEAGLRPAFTIEAQPGLGEGCVEGQDHNDRWIVGSRADVIVERVIPVKHRRVVLADGDGIRNEAIFSPDPSLSDDQVIELAQLVASIRRHYRRLGHAREIDVEFVRDTRGVLHIVQARAKSCGTADVTSDDRRVVRFAVVDQQRVPADTPRVTLSRAAAIANSGAVTGRLQIVHTGEQQSRMVRTHAIVVTHHTNNTWNSEFGKLAGLITVEGGMTSHAAQNCQALNLPSIVGAIGALEQLAPFDGQLVTLDTDSRTVYAGRLPLVVIEPSLSVWNDDAAAEAFMREREVHEIFRPWPASVDKRPEVFIEHLGRRWRRRSANYGLFQIDCYCLAWDRLTRYLNDRFTIRRQWKLGALQRDVLVQMTMDQHRMGLVQEVIVNDPLGVYAFIDAVRGFDLEDAQRLFDDRWRGFRDFGTFMDGLHVIDPGNVATVVDRYVDVLKWMHMAFWLDAIVEERQVAPQLQYVNPLFHALLRAQAVTHPFTRRERAAFAGASIAPGRADVRTGDVVHLSRVKDREMYDVLERVRADEPLAQRVIAAAPADLADAWRASSIGGELLDRIDGWSTRFKRVTEDLRDQSDTADYLVDIQERLRHGATCPVDVVVDLYIEYLDARGPGSPATARIDMQLETLLRAQARLFACQRRIDDWTALPEDRHGADLCSVSAGEIDAALPEAIAALRRLVDAEQQRRRDTAFVLDRFDTLRRTLALSKMQVMLKEDGHHLIVPYQRALARLMRDVAARRVDILGRPERIFEIGADELVALVCEERPAYIAATLERWRILREAELLLHSQVRTGEADALSRYAAAVADICAMLDQQQRDTKTERTRRAYAAEKSRLLAKVTHLRSRSWLGHASLS